MSVTNVELLELSKREGIKLRPIVFKDELKNLHPVNGNYIINLSNSTDSDGTHWIGLAIKENQALYFDSFGAICPKEVYEFIKQRKGCRLAFSNQIIQNMSSEMCGFFCLAFFIFIKHSKNLYDRGNNFFRLNFNNDTRENDRLLKRFFVKHSKNPNDPLLQKLLKRE